MRHRIVLMLLGITAIMLAAWFSAQSSTRPDLARADNFRPGTAATSLSAVTPFPVVTATPDLGITTAVPRTPPSLPTASPDERRNASKTRLYLSFFQSQSISVIDPKSGHSLHEIPMTGDRAGAAVAPDGTRLYVVDGASHAQLRVLDTSTWRVIHEEPVEDFATLFSNPISLSGDGRWLEVAHYSRVNQRGWLQVFDTQKLEFLATSIFPASDCADATVPIPWIGRPGYPRLFAECRGSIYAVDSETLSLQWRQTSDASPSRNAQPMLVVVPHSDRLYELYPLGSNDCSEPSKLDLRLSSRETGTGRQLQQTNLSSQVSILVPPCGNGGQSYLSISPDGSVLYVVLDDRLWKLDALSFRVTAELHVPAPIVAVAISVDGRELYLLVSQVGDSSSQEQGMWTVDTALWQIVRHTTDWPVTSGLTGIGFFNATLEAAPVPP